MLLLPYIPFFYHIKYMYKIANRRPTSNKSGVSALFSDRSSHTLGTLFLSADDTLISPQKRVSVHAPLSAE
jgi:hypothetical protein